MKKEYGVIAFLLGVTIFISCNNNQSKNGTEVIKIGIIVPLSGNGATIGTDTKNGIELAVDEVNKAGGLLGKKVEIEIQDSKSDPKEGLSIIKNMLSKENKPFMIYSIISGVTMAIRPETENNKMILMSAVGTDKFINNANYTIRTYVAATSIGKNIIPYIKDSLKSNSFGIFYANNEYSTSVKNAIEHLANDKALTIQFSQSFDEKNPDYKSLIAASINDKTECVFVDGIGKAVGLLIKQIREGGYKGLIVSDPIIKSPDIEASAGDAIKGVYYMDFAYDNSSSDPNIKAFTEAFKTKYNALPANFAVISYEGLRILFSKINEMKTLDGDKIIQAMNAVKNYKGVFGPVDIENRELQFSYTFKHF